MVGNTVAENPLLETKLYIPKWRSGLVSRRRLIERMRQGIERNLTLIFALPDNTFPLVLAVYTLALIAALIWNKLPKVEMPATKTKKQSSVLLVVARVLLSSWRSVAADFRAMKSRLSILIFRPATAPASHASSWNWRISQPNFLKRILPFPRSRSSPTIC